MPGESDPTCHDAVLEAGACLVVAAEERVRPGARPGQRVVLDDDRAVEHRLLLAVGLEPLVRLRPDALGVVDLAQAVARPAARAVALVLRALRLRADVGDLGERAVAAVLAGEQRHLGGLLERMGHPPHGSRGLVDAAVDAPSGREERRVAREDRVVEAAAEPVLDGHAQVGSPLSLRLEVGGVHDVGRETGLRDRARRSGTPPGAGTGSRARTRASRRPEGVGARR